MKLQESSNKASLKDQQHIKSHLTHFSIYSLPSIQSNRVYKHTSM